jgi:cytochrome c
MSMLASFVHDNMPPGAAKALSPEESFDVAAFVLSKTRPLFHGSLGCSLKPLPFLVGEL